MTINNEFCILSTRFARCEGDAIFKYLQRRRSMRMSLVWDDEFSVHDMGEAALFVPAGGLVETDQHIDNPRRAMRTRNLFNRAGLDAKVSVLKPRPASVEEIERVHSAQHVERMRQVSALGGGDAGGGYTPMDGRSYGLALLSAGSALTALESVMTPGPAAAYAMVRRSGHHASRETGYGFAIFNNVAIAARAAQWRFGVERVAIVDIDAHHGNGTEAIFYADPSVLTVSIHQDRQFPIETGGADSLGESDAIGTNFNVNLLAGTGDDGYLHSVDAIVEPALRSFKPGLILVACGVDASFYDPMARLAVTAQGFRGVGERLRKLAAVLCGKLVLVQEGGYSPQYAPFCTLAIVEAVAGTAPSADPFEPFLAGNGARKITDWQRRSIDESARRFEGYWCGY